LISFPENSYFGPFTPKLQPERRDTEEGVQVERERERERERWDVRKNK